MCIKQRTTSITKPRQQVTLTLFGIMAPIVVESIAVELGFDLCDLNMRQLHQNNIQSNENKDCDDNQDSGHDVEAAGSGGVISGTLHVSKHLSVSGLKKQKQSTSHIFQQKLLRYFCFLYFMLQMCMSFINRLYIYIYVYTFCRIFCMLLVCTFVSIYLND